MDNCAETGANSTPNTLVEIGDKELYESLYSALYGYVVPTICVVGFLGNVLNLVILAGKRQQRALKEKERSANLGLIALAVADMCFCVSAFPSTFLPRDMVFTGDGFMALYGCYCAAIINVFIMTSTWVTVAMSTERYLAICHPLRSRNIITFQRTKLAIVMVYVLSSLFNLPVFWRYTIVPVLDPCTNTPVVAAQGTSALDVMNSSDASVAPALYTIHPRLLLGHATLDHAYRAVWAVLGNLIPLALLLVFNVALARQIHRSRQMRGSKERGFSIRLTGDPSGIVVHHHPPNDSSESTNLINITLIAIVAMFFILVAPSEVLKHVASLMGQTRTQNYTYLTIELITNIMQGINFSANFMLYFIINKSFRRRTKEMFCVRKARYRGISNRDL